MLISKIEILEAQIDTYQWKHMTLVKKHGSEKLPQIGEALKSKRTKVILRQHSWSCKLQVGHQEKESKHGKLHQWPLVEKWSCSKVPDRLHMKWHPLYHIFHARCRMVPGRWGPPNSNLCNQVMHVLISLWSELCIACVEEIIMKNKKNTSKNCMFSWVGVSQKFFYFPFIWLS